MLRLTPSNTLLALLASSAACGPAVVAPPPPPPPDPGLPSCWEPAPLDDASPLAATAPFARYVDPHIGTGGVGFGVGSAFPGPQRPFGMARPGPDTRQAGGAVSFLHCSGYAYEDPYIYGFSQTRMHGTGIVDYGTLGLMPTLGMSPEKTTAEGRMQAYSHDDEDASPSSYEVTLGDGIGVGLTASDHVSWYSLTFPASPSPGSEPTVLLDVGHALPDVTIVDGSVFIDANARLVTGFAHFSGGYSDRFGGMPVHFAARFSEPFAAFGVWKAGALFAGETARQGGDTGAWFEFDAATTEVGVTIGLSFVSGAQALENLDAEAPAASTADFAQAFAAARDDAESEWEGLLGRLEVEAYDERDLELAYTALYHTLLMPTLGSDADGTYVGLDGATHVASDFRYYTDLSIWDTYRTLHPWLSVLYPEAQRDMLRSMTAMSVQAGAPPQWPLGIGETYGMVGEGAAIVFADSWLRGVRDFDAEAAYEVLRASATGPLPQGGRERIDEYVAKGYVSIESGGSSGSLTLEYALDDFALAGFADALGKSSDASLFAERAGSWKNLYDPTSELLLGRYADGTFPNTDDHTVWQDYWAEGTSWQYTWFAPHDVPGLAATMGGRDAFVRKLDDYFALSTCEPPGNLLPKAYYWHSNEPVLFVPYAYAELDDAARASRWVRWARETFYGDGPDGLPGNDDSGTMSAWWLFAATGFFPSIGTAEYLVAAPAFASATLHRPGGDLVIRTKGPRGGVAVAATLDGKPLPRPRFAHEQLEGGATLEIELSATAQPWNP